MNHSKPYRSKSRYVSWQPSEGIGIDARKLATLSGFQSFGRLQSSNCICLQRSGKKKESYGDGNCEQLIDKGFRNVEA